MPYRYLIHFMIDINEFRKYRLATTKASGVLLPSFRPMMLQRFQWYDYNVVPEAWQCWTYAAASCYTMDEFQGYILTMYNSNANLYLDQTCPRLNEINIKSKM